MSAFDKRDEGASMPATLIVAIVVAGIIVSLFAVVQSGVRSSRIDRDAGQSIQVADAGVQQALVQLRGVEPDDPPGCTPPDGVTNTPTEGRCTDVDGIGTHTAFEWRYEQTAPFAYQVLSVGTYRDHTSAVSVDIVRPLSFMFAITTKSQFTYNGGGGGLEPPIAVGTFANATVNGQQAIDSIDCVGMLYPPDEEPPDTDAYNIDPEELHCESMQEGPDLSKDHAREACFDGEERIASDPAQHFYSDHDDGVDGFPLELERGASYCIRGEKLAMENYVVDPDPVHFPDGYSEENPPPAFVYIVGDVPGSPAGGLEVGSAGKGQQSTVGVNWGDDPNAGYLFVAIAEGAGNFTINGNGRMAAGLWAPWSACTFNGNPSYRGAIVCDAVTLNGSFEYDDEVESLEVGTVVTRSWSQEAPPAWATDVQP